MRGRVPAMSEFGKGAEARNRIRHMDCAETQGLIPTDWRHDVARIREALHPKALAVVLRDGTSTPYARTLWNEGAVVKLRLPAYVGVRLMGQAAKAGVIG